MRVVLDTNVFVSAAISLTGPPSSIVDRWSVRDFDLVLSDALLAEVEEVLGRSQLARFFRRPAAWIADLLSDLRAGAYFVVPTPADAIPNDPPDNLVLGTAEAGAADYIVSGNRHLLDLGSYRGIPILTPRQFLSVLEEAS